MIFLCPLVLFLHAISLLDISFMTIINKTSVFLCFVISILYLCVIVLLLQRWYGMTLTKKVLLKLSFILKSRKFDCCEDDSDSTTSWFVQPQLALYIPLVWAIALSNSKGNARAWEWDKANIVPTPYFILTAFFWGLRGMND